MTPPDDTDWSTNLLMLASFTAPAWWFPLDQMSHVAALILPLAALTWWGVKIMTELVGLWKSIRKKK